MFNLEVYPLWEKEEEKNVFLIRIYKLDKVVGITEVIVCNVIEV